MDVEFCKHESGHHLTFYGAISTQQVLPRVGPQELKGKAEPMEVYTKKPKTKGGKCIIYSDIQFPVRKA